MGTRASEVFPYHSRCFLWGTLNGGSIRGRTPSPGQPSGRVPQTAFVARGFATSVRHWGWSLCRAFAAADVCPRGGLLKPPFEAVRVCRILVCTAGDVPVACDLRPMTEKT